MLAGYAWQSYNLRLRFPVEQKMIRSMTGFARVEGAGDWGTLAWEMRSVNHRYLDISFRLPEEFRALENDFRALASSKLRRGKVEVQIRFTAQGSALGAIAVDQQKLAQLRGVLDDVTEALGATSAADPMRVLAWPGVVVQKPADLSAMLSEAQRLFETAVEQLDDSRCREGDDLRQFICERCDLIEAAVIRVRARYPQVRDQWRVKLQERCTELGVEVEPGRLEQEAVIAAQRLDVDEELSRLSGHLVEVRRVLDRDEAVGRRLDFLMQELNREANTLGSKSQDGEMTREAVDIKVAIEQMREQVQNIE